MISRDEASFISQLRFADSRHPGPGEVSIISPNAAFTILGPGGCLKSPWYDYGYGQPLNSLHSTRDVAVHESRRRIWDRGFGSKGEALAFRFPPITVLMPDAFSVAGL